MPSLILNAPPLTRTPAALVEMFEWRGSEERRESTPFKTNLLLNACVVAYAQGACVALHLVVLRSSALRAIHLLRLGYTGIVGKAEEGEVFSS